MKNKILDNDLIPTWDGSGCPSNNILTNYLHEKLGDAISQEVTAHLFLCRRCQAVCDKQIEKEHERIRTAQRK